MASRILIVSKGAAFMTDAISKNLDKAGFETEVTEPEIKKIEEKIRDIDIYLFFAGSYIFDSTDVLVYLKDICNENEKSLCVIGYQEEIEEIRRNIPPTVISSVIERPFDMKSLVDEFKKLEDKDEERKKRKSILLVDDDVAFLKMMQDWLSLKYNVTVTRSGMQAITYIANHVPDLILLDYEMPITSGPQVMEMIKSEPNSNGIPIVFLTGRSDRESVMSVMKLKPQGYLLKTMDRSQIMKAVDEFFENARVEKHLG